MMKLGSFPGWATITLVIVAGLVVTQMLRYEYGVHHQMRIDRLTGERQFHCHVDNSWRSTDEECYALRNSQRAAAASNSSPPNATAASNVGNDSRISTSDSIAEIYKRNGFLCVDDGKSLICGKDLNGNGRLDPWEYPWKKKSDGTFKLGENPPLK